MAKQLSHRSDVGACLQQMGADECSNVWTDTCLAMPACSTAFFICRLSLSPKRWWRRSTPVCGSTASLADGNT